MCLQHCSVMKRKKRTGKRSQSVPANSLPKRLKPKSKVNQRIKRKLYRSDQIKNAVEDIKAGMNVMKAAKKWSVPRTTLQNRKKWISGGH